MWRVGYASGVPSCANDWLLQKVARDEWSFDGYITSDCGADNDVFFNHHYTKTPEESVAAVLQEVTNDSRTATSIRKKTWMKVSKPWANSSPLADVVTVIVTLERMADVLKV